MDNQNHSFIIFSTDGRTSSKQNAPSTFFQKWGHNNESIKTELQP